MEKLTMLVATDFAESSAAVLKKAIDFAQKTQATLHVVHVVENTFFQKNQNIDFIKEHCWDSMLSHYPSLHKEHFYCFEGNVETVVAIVAQTIGAKIVLIGDNRDKHPLEAIFISSDTKAIIRESHTPILVAKNHENRVYNTILIPTDLSKDSWAMIQHMTYLFPESLLILLHLYSVPFEFRLGMYGFNESEIISFHEESRKAAETELNTFIQALDVPAKNIIPIVRKDLLNSERFEANHKDLRADLVAIHTTGNISFFAFDLLEKSQSDVLIYKVNHD